MTDLGQCWIDREWWVALLPSPQSARLCTLTLTLSRRSPVRHTSLLSKQLREAVASRVGVLRSVLLAPRDDQGYCPMNETKVLRNPAMWALRAFDPPVSPFSTAWVVSRLKGVASPSLKQRSQIVRRYFTTSATSWFWNLFDTRRKIAAWQPA